jgi:hypothetical protein
MTQDNSGQICGQTQDTRDKNPCPTEDTQDKPPRRAVLCPELELPCVLWGRWSRQRSALLSSEGEEKQAGRKEHRRAPTKFWPVGVARHFLLHHIACTCFICKGFQFLMFLLFIVLRSINSAKPRHKYSFDTEFRTTAAKRSMALIPRRCSTDG